MLLWLLPHRSIWAAISDPPFNSRQGLETLPSAGARHRQWGRQGQPSMWVWGGRTTSWRTLKTLRDACLCPKTGREWDQPCPQPSTALGSSPHASLYTCTLHPGPQPELGSLLAVSQLPAATTFVLQHVVVVVVMALMGPAVQAATFHQLSCFLPAKGHDPLACTH